MIDLVQYGLLTIPGDTTVNVVHLPCGDTHPVINLDQAVAWAGDHVCGP